MAPVITLQDVFAGVPGGVTSNSGGGGTGGGTTSSSSSTTQIAQDPFSLCGCSQDGYSGEVSTGKAGCIPRIGERFTYVMICSAFPYLYCSAFQNSISNIFDFLYRYH